MLPKKPVQSASDAVREIPDGAVLMIGEFAGPGGFPYDLVHALRDRGTRDLTIICNTASGGLVVNFEDHGILFENNQVRKIVCSYPADVTRDTIAKRQISSGQVELELVPQGTLAERIRAGGAGIPAFYVPAAVGTPIGQGKEIRSFDGREYLLERGLRADFALIRAHEADQHGNLTYRGTAKHFNPIMAMAADRVIAEVDLLVDDLSSNVIVTPGIFVDTLVIGTSVDLFPRGVSHG